MSVCLPRDMKNMPREITSASTVRTLPGYLSDQHRRWTGSGARVRSGSCCEARGLPIPGQKVRDFVCRVIRQACQHVGEPSLGIDVVELACLDKGIDRGCSVAPGIGTREGPIFSSDGNLAAILPISGRMSSSIIAGI